MIPMEIDAAPSGLTEFSRDIIPGPGGTWLHDFAPPELLILPLAGPLVSPSETPSTLPRSRRP